MRRFVLLLLLIPTTLAAQSTQRDLEARLVKQPLYLRGFWRDDTLKFDQAGTLAGSSPTTSFTLSGVEVSKIHLNADRLVLEGRRMGVEFNKDIPQRVPLNVGTFSVKDEKVRIEIAGPPSGDYASVLNTIFATDLAELALTLPDGWQKYEARLQGEPAQPHQRQAIGTKRVGGPVVPPKVLFAPEPAFSKAARALKYSGNVLVYLQVDLDGKPDHIAILRPAGLGLDEQALAAVSKYKFNPAMENGQPVRVEMNVEVNFQVF